MTNIKDNIAVVLCDCGGTLRDRLDFEKLQKHLSRLPDVATVKLCSNFCQEKETLRAIKSLKKTNADRLIIGACNREIFDENLCLAMGNENFNQGLCWCVNIREHCAWVHRPETATDKAIDILTCAIERTRLAESVKSKKIGINQDVLVLGSGVAAMQAAVELSGFGHKVLLATTDDCLGGLTAKSPQLFAYIGSDSAEAEKLVQNRCDELIEQINEDERIRVQANASLKSIQGRFGNFTAVIDSQDDGQSFTVGAVVLATGSAVSPLGSELTKIINSDAAVPKRIAIVIDIAAEQGRDISGQVLSAAELLAKRFSVEVKVYCRHLRVAATGLEDLYKRARQSQVVFIKYEKPPVISEQGSKKLLTVFDPVLGGEVSELFDLVIKADGAETNGNSELLKLIEGLRSGPGGLLQYDNVWLLPTGTNLKGIYIAGSARGNSELRDAQADGLAAANQIHELLGSEKIEVFDDAATVDDEKCVICLTCMRVCPHGAISIDIEKSVASVSAVTCQRCGICAAQCPAGAIELPRYTDEQIAAEIGNKPEITIFACENSAWPAATAAGTNGCEYPAEIRLIRVPCAGKVDSRQILAALECGAGKVLILGCHPENCQYLTGSTRAKKTIVRLNDMLKKAGIDEKKVVFGPLASLEAGKFLKYVRE